MINTITTIFTLLIVLVLQLVSILASILIAILTLPYVLYSMVVEYKYKDKVRENNRTNECK
jgi:Ca2+/Na+ antiporter